MSETIQRLPNEKNPFVPGVRAPEPCSVVIFGGTGDLATRKLFPALYGLWHDGYLPERFLIVGVSNLDFTDTSFRDLVAKAIVEHHPGATTEASVRFAAN